MARTQHFDHHGQSNLAVQIGFAGHHGLQIATEQKTTTLVRGPGFPLVAHHDGAAGSGLHRLHERFSCHETPYRSLTQPNRVLNP